ncbi:hypothetical protein [Demequina soli]|uniref:hypothetical protein n=1 Tax=Demequina soli TaxID=1638987 RepID=UPI00078263E5|nr:hypothetical protein [Demequina soli]
MADDCNDLPAIDGDPGILLGTDWSGERHAYGDTVVVYGCFAPTLGGTVSLVAAGTGMTVVPDMATVDEAGTGVTPFAVTVARGATGELRIRWDGRGGGAGDLSGPTVIADGDGWRFTSYAAQDEPSRAS